jgi:predicted Zn-dependent peptidase
MPSLLLPQSFNPILLCVQNYAHHAIVKFLESIGASFGACQNAYTSCDETVYTLMVRTDDDQLLDTSIGVLSEFAARIR